jgi:hypothetical protein
MSVYTSFIALATRLIQKWGMDCTVLSPVAGAPIVPGQDWKPTNGTAVSNTLRLAFLPEETINFYSKTHSLIAKEDYVVGYEYYLLSGGSLFIPQQDQILIKPNGEQWKVKYCKEYAPAGERVLWIVGIKR